MINVGFVGCGRIADLHVPGYRGRDDARIYAVCDVRREVAEQRQKEWGAERAYTDYRELLADPKLDAVEILTPQLLHEPMLAEAVAAKKHVAVQKPLTIDLASATRMEAAARASGRICKVTENYVFYPPIREAKRLIDAGAIGEPIAIRIKYLGGSCGGWEVPAAAWEWRVKEAAAGRGFTTFDHGHHLWSTAWYLLGPVERVSGWIDSLDGVVDTPALIIWKYRDKKRYGTCELVNAPELRVPSKYYANDEWIEITGAKGIIFISRCTGNVHDGPPMMLFDGKSWRSIDGLDSDWQAGFTGATHNFIDAIQGKAEPLWSIAQGTEILRFALAIQRAAQERREVYLDEMEKTIAPARYSRRRVRAEQRAQRGGGFWSFLGFGESFSKYGPLAVSLTQELVDNHDRQAAAIVETIIGLHLAGDGVEEKLTLRIEKGDVRLVRGDIPEDAKLVVKMPAGLWAAILMRKKRLETALFQGKIKFEGRAEEGLKLKDVFKF